MTAPSPPESAPLAGVTGVGMAFVGGYVDVIGFVLLFGLFVAHATGNLVMLGVALAGNGEGLATKLLALPVFVSAAAAAYALVKSRKARGLPCEAVVLVVQAVLLLAFMLLTLRAAPAVGGDRPEVMAAAFVGVAAMAVQNVGARVVFARLAPTTMMTGNVTQIAIDIVDIVANRGVDESLRARLLKTWPPILAFAAGAAAGAAGVVLAGAWSLSLAAALVTALAVAHAIAARRAGGRQRSSPQR